MGRVGEAPRASVARPRPVGGTAHVLAFVLWSVIAAGVAAGGGSMFIDVMAPGGPIELHHLSDAEVIERFARSAPPETIEGRLAALEGLGTPLALPGDEVAIAERYARARQFALDLEDVRRHTTTAGLVALIVVAGIAASRVDGRLRDGLLIAVPIVQIVFASRVMWRLTSPQVYWTRRAAATPAAPVTVGTGFLVGVGGALVSVLLVAALTALLR